MNAIKIYEKIPKNKELMLDLILRNVLLKEKYKVDVGIKRFPVYDAVRGMELYEGKIEAIGDLSVFSGFDEYDMNGYSIFPGEKETEKKIVKSREEYLFELVKKGITTIEVLELSARESNFGDFPLNLIREGCDFKHDLFPGNFANFYLINKKGEIDYVVVNGFLINRISNSIAVHNAIRM